MMSKADLKSRVQVYLLLISLALGTVYALSYYFLLDFWPPPSPELDVDKVVMLYENSNIKFRIGIALMILTGAFYLPWSVVISFQMYRQERGLPIFTALQALSSAVATWFFVFPPVIWGLAAFSITRNPEITVMLNEAAWLSFLTPAAFFPLQTIPIAIVALTSRDDVLEPAFPRWIGWLTLWNAMTGSLGPFAQIFKSGPFAWNGLIPFYLPTIVFGLWMGAMAFVMFRSLKRQDDRFG